MSNYSKLKSELKIYPKVWLVTGVAGFIGSNLLEALLKLDQKVVGLDNFSTGRPRNLDEVEAEVLKRQWDNFTLLEGDICEYETCVKAVSGIDYVLHQAALGSVPRSIADPISTNSSNVTGFLNILQASKEAGVKSFTYAASSSTYGDHPALPKVEEKIGSPLSPYAVTKYVNELYASVYARTYGFKSIGLRYFNVFGKRQDPESVYAAVIPKWIASNLEGESVYINGDGETSRDFCYIDNVIQMNLLSAVAKDSVKNEVYNVAVGARTTLNKLHSLIVMELESRTKEKYSKPIYKPFRLGDVRHSQADIDKARRNLGYNPEWTVEDGIKNSILWYFNNLKKPGSLNV